jgi:hypothetical protein
LFAAARASTHSTGKNRACRTSSFAATWATHGFAARISAWRFSAAARALKWRALASRADVSTHLRHAPSPTGK